MPRLQQVLTLLACLDHTNLAGVSTPHPHLQAVLPKPIVRLPQAERSNHGARGRRTASQHFVAAVRHGVLLLPAILHAASMRAKCKA